MSALDFFGALVASAVVLVLPGLGLRQIASRPLRSVPHELTAGVLGSAVVVSAVGLVSIGLGVFTPTLVAAVAVATSIASVPRCVALAVATDPRQRLVAGVLSAAVVPVAWSTQSGTYAPADTFQWFYWELGRTLTEHRGVPSLVAEYGTYQRWLPDYISFNVMSETYGRLLFWLDEPTKLVLWRTLPALLGIGLVYAVSRLWFSRWAAVCGALLLVGVEFWDGKWNAYKPESIGVVFGLCIIWHATDAIRAGHRRRFIAAASLLGLGLSIHAIATFVAALGLAASASVAVLTGRTDRMGRVRRWAPVAVGGVAAALVVTMSLGWAFQGRALVAGDASNPVVTEGPDATWTFLAYSSGSFDRPDPPSGLARVPRRARAPLFDYDLTVGVGRAAPALLMAAVVALALFSSPGRRREGHRVLIAWVALASAAISFFVFGFDTYVPQNTGSSRIAQYLPFIAVFAVVGLFDQLLARWNVVAARVALLVVIAPMGLSLGFAFAQDARGVTDDGRSVLAFVEANASPGDRVISNVPTFGLLETFTGIEAPNEGRQPLIEDPEFLVIAIDGLRSTKAFFDDPGSVPVPYGARWIVVSEDPLDLSYRNRFDAGRSIERLGNRTGLSPVFQAGRTAVFDTGASSPAQPVVTTVVAPARTTGAVAIWSVLALATIGTWPRRRPPSQPE